MCGILGGFAWRGSLDPERALPSLVNLLRHRGPDEGAFWGDAGFFFGHRRLSIIDLAGGSQPMASPDGSLVIAFNGEIYNYAELRQELRRRHYSFATNSDTEVLLHGYREWGVDLPKRLLGMFALAIADRRKQELYLARDRFGEKPLLYVEEADSVRFASELRPLAALPRLPRRLDEEALASYLCLNYVPGNRTLLDGVRRLAPACWRKYDSRGLVEAGEYWVPPSPPERRGLGLGEAADELRCELDRAVRLALVSDVPVGIFLSGGMDSSLIAESAARQGGLSRAYCLDFPDQGYSEYPKAKQIAEKLSLPLDRVPFSMNAAGDFLAIVDHADDPLADSSALAVWAVARAAARANKVVLGGDGGDELFAGYLTYQATLLHAAVIARLPAAARQILARAASLLPTRETKVSWSYQLMRFLRASALLSREAHFTWNGTWLPEQASLLFPKPNQAIARLAQRHGLGEPPGLGDLQRADLSDYLPNDILAKVDRMSMAHGLEVRAPFLQPAIAELALAFPSELRCRLGGRPKRVLRELALRIFGPRIGGAPKQGFSIPIHTWLRGAGRGLVEDLLSPASIRTIGVLDTAAVARVVSDHMSGRRSYGWEVWGLMVLSAWHRVRIAAAPPPAKSDGLIRRHIPFGSGEPARAPA